MSRGRIFADRTEAGRALADRVKEKGFESPVVLALPRGGVPVGFEIAHALGAPLDLILVRKIGVPFQPELALAAVVDGHDPEIIVNEDVAALTGASQEFIDAEAAAEIKEIERRRAFYLEGREPVNVEGRTAIIVDDGIATGASIRAALTGIRRRQPKKVVLAVPVAPASTVDSLGAEADEIICLETPEPFIAIGIHYRDFHQLTDHEVKALLAEADRQMKQPGAG